MKRRDEFSVHSEHVQRNLKQMRREGRLATSRKPLQSIDPNVSRLDIHNTNKPKRAIPLSSLTLSFRGVHEKVRQNQTRNNGTEIVSDIAIASCSIRKPKANTNYPNTHRIQHTHSDMWRTLTRSRQVLDKLAEGHLAGQLAQLVADWMQINQLEYEKTTSPHSTSSGSRMSSGQAEIHGARKNMTQVIKGYGYRRHQHLASGVRATVMETHSLGTFLISCQLRMESGNSDHIVKVLLMKPDSELRIRAGDALELFTSTKVSRNINGCAVDLYMHWNRVQKMVG